MQGGWGGYSWTVSLLLFFLGGGWSASGRGGESTASKLAKLFLLKESDKMERKNVAQSVTIA